MATVERTRRCVGRSRGTSSPCPRDRSRDGARRRKIFGRAPGIGDTRGRRARTALPRARCVISWPGTISITAHARALRRGWRTRRRAAAPNACRGASRSDRRAVERRGLAGGGPSAPSLYTRRGWKSSVVEQHEVGAQERSPAGGPSGRASALGEPSPSAARPPARSPPYGDPAHLVDVVLAEQAGRARGRPVENAQCCGSRTAAHSGSRSRRLRAGRRASRLAPHMARGRALLERLANVVAIVIGADPAATYASSAWPVTPGAWPSDGRRRRRGQPARSNGPGVAPR